MVCIYKIVSPENIVYIGQTRNLTHRVARHKYAKYANQLYDSIKKFGWETHSVEVLHELPVDTEQAIMDQYEEYYLEAYLTAGIKLFNIRGGGIHGKVAEQTKMKISIASKGKIIPSDVRSKISISNKGKQKSASHVEKMIKTKSLQGWNTGKKQSEETKQKISLAHKGKQKKKHSVEANKKKSENLKGNTYRLGQSASDATRKKISDKLKAYFLNKKKSENAI